MNVLPHSCRVRKGTLAEQARTTVCLSKPSCECFLLAALGVICPVNFDYGIACINALPGAYGKAVWHRMLSKLARDADFEEVFIDSTMMRTHQHAAGNPKKTATKPLGEAGDSLQTLPLIQGLQPGALCADKAYDTDAIIEHLAAEGIEAVVPPRRNRRVQRPFDKHRYKSRNLVERFFCRIKQFRCIATYYDKLATQFASFVASVIWLA